jgi:perosamine synthetase
MALRALSIGPGDEVIIPDYTYPATASVVAIVGAKGVIVDINPVTMLIDYEALQAAITPRTKAIIPVSLFGNPLDYDILNSIKNQYGLYIIEDAACAVGAEYKGVKVGNFADITVFSFHPRKFITTGEGGMITTNNEKWAEWMHSYKHFGMASANDREKICFDKVGTNYKLSNVLSAIGLAQLKQIKLLLIHRRELAGRYNELFAGKNKITAPQVTKNGLHSYQSYCIFIESRDEILNGMRSEGTEVQIGTYALHMHPAFQNQDIFTLKGEFPGSGYAYTHCLTLPLFHEISQGQQEYIVNRVCKNI